MLANLSSLWSSVYPILIAILCFEIIIIVHEGGHFIAARLNGIRVNEFAIGMGPKIVQFTKKDTKYTLRLFLIGGYCSMEGEDEDSQDEAAFSKKKVWQRISVVVAGALMNLLLGLVVVFAMVCSNDLVGTHTIAKFDQNAKSAQVLQVGDTIKSIDGMRVYTSNDVSTGLSRSADSTIEMVVLRDGKEQKVEVEFDMQTYEGHQFVTMDFWLLGVDKTPANVLKSTFTEWISYGRMVFLSVYDMISGRYGFSDLSGPVGAVDAVSTAVQTSSYAVLRLVALLTINIGLFNLFPIPALDGWRLFLLIFEGITKRKIPSKFEWAINAAGLVLLLGLMCVITFSDITKLI